MTTIVVGRGGFLENGSKLVVGQANRIQKNICHEL